MATQKEKLIKEEKSALDTPIDARIHTAELPPQTEKEVEDYCDKMWRQYPCFKTKEDAMYFSMLPLSRTDSTLVLKRAMEIEKQTQKESDKWRDPISAR
jgi:hypothetical protein